MKRRLVFNTRLDTGAEVEAEVLIRVSPKLDDSGAKIILPFSIFSKLYDGDEGKIKVEAFLRFVREYVEGKPTVLLCEKAHLKTFSLKFQGAEAEATALKECLLESGRLVDRFKRELTHFAVVHWGDFVDKNCFYPESKEQIYNLYEHDMQFRELVKVDSENSYNEQRRKEYPDEEEYIKNSSLDILEQCICMFIASKMGYKYLLYPGSPITPFDYVNKTLLQGQFTRINVSLHKPVIAPRS